MGEAEPATAPPKTVQNPVNLWRRAFPTWWALMAALFVCVIVPTSLIVTHIHENPRLSPIDEGAQFDYISRVAHGSIPRLGQRLLPTTLEMISCTGVAYPASLGPPCPGVKNPNAYAAGGYQYEAQQPPTYYAATVPIRWIGVHVLGVSSLTAARLGGALWVSLGLLTLWIAAGLLEISILGRMAIVLLLASASSVIYQASIVSNDAPSIFAGAAVALAAVWSWHRTSRWTAPALLAIGCLAASFKLDDGLAALVAAGVLAVAWYGRVAGQHQTGRAARRAWLRAWGPSGGALLVGAAATALGWTIVSRHLSLIDPRTLPSFGILRQAPVTLGQIAREALSLFDPLNGSYHPPRTNAAGTAIGPALSLNLQTITSTFVEYLLLGAGLAGLFAKPRTWAHVTGILSIGALYLGGIVLGVSVWKTYASDPGLSGRYGLSVAPLLALALVALIKGKWVLRAFGAGSAVLAALAFVFILAA